MTRTEALFKIQDAIYLAFMYEGAFRWLSLNRGYLAWLKLKENEQADEHKTDAQKD